jgi:hypothetical protein
MKEAIDDVKNDNLFFFATMVFGSLGVWEFGSWGVGQVEESTNSILASACVHLIIQIMMFNALIKNGISGDEKLIILIVSVILWLGIIKKWEKENTVDNIA